MRLDFPRVLVLGAHTDDEFGCSGTIVRLLEQGSEVFLAAFSICEESVPPGYPRDILGKEVMDATSTLGVSADHVLVHNYRVRHFPSFRQEILEDLVKLREKIRPNLVLLPSLEDVHQDHQVIAREGVRAFKFSSVLGYELPMNLITFRHACFVSLTEAHIRRKVEAMSRYRTQQFRAYAEEEFLRGLAKVRGVQAGTEFAEAFEVIRFIL